MRVKAALLRRPARCLAVGIAVAIVFGIFFFGGRPVAAGLFPEPWDKLAHFTAYGALAVALCVASAGRRPLLTVAAVTLIGALDEWEQVYLPGRSADLVDFLTDEVAAVMAVTLYEFLLMRRSASAQPS